MCQAFYTLKTKQRPVQNRILRLNGFLGTFILLSLQQRVAELDFLEIGDIVNGVRSYRGDEILLVLAQR